MYKNKLIPKNLQNENVIYLLKRWNYYKRVLVKNTGTMRNLKTKHGCKLFIITKEVVNITN